MPERAPQPAMRQMRMPAIDEFPPQVKRQIEAQQSRIESIAEHAQKKKAGPVPAPGPAWASAARTIRRRQPAAREPSIAVQQRPSLQPRQQADPPAQPPQLQDPHLDDDQLEIPAFLRRQAN